MNLSVVSNTPMFGGRFSTRQVVKGATGAALIAGGAVSLATLTANPIGVNPADAHSLPLDSHGATDSHALPGASHGTEHAPVGGHGVDHGHPPTPEKAINYLNNTAIATVLSGPMALGSSTLGGLLMERNCKIEDPKDTVDLPANHIETLKAQLAAATQAQQELEKKTTETLQGDLKKVFGGLTVESLLTGLFQEKSHEAHHLLAGKVRTAPALKNALVERMSLVGEPRGLIAHIKLHFTKKRIEKELVHHAIEGLTHLESTGMAKAHGGPGDKNRFTVLTPLGVMVRNRLLNPACKTDKDGSTVVLTPTP